MLSLALLSLLVASPLFAQAPRVSAATPPPDVAAPPADAAKRPSGLASKVITPGTGKTHPTAADIVTVHYTGWKTDGSMFDSSVSGFLKRSRTKASASRRACWCSTSS
jgi:hypothetical protein